MDNESSWLESLGLRERAGTPDLILGSEQAAPLFPRMSPDLVQIIDAVLMLGGSPAVVFVRFDKETEHALEALFKILWNQGRASVLVARTHRSSEIRIYSLWQMPNASNDERLVTTLDLASQSIAARSLIESIEAGTFFSRNKEKFDPRTKVDAVLLRNLKNVHGRLQGLPDDAGKALILQIVFIAYLEDRGIIDATDFLNGTGRYTSLLEVLAASDPNELTGLFSYLRTPFNGDVFIAPGVITSAKPNRAQQSTHPTIGVANLSILRDFRAGELILDSGQSRFWPYNFKYIPVDLISAIYDRFLNDDEANRSDTGSFYTPRVLADLVVDQLWQTLEPSVRAGDFTVLDPSCGSAIFLVRLFAKIVEDRVARSGRPVDWKTLCDIVLRLNGWDIEENAVQIGVFSLYIALLDQVDPPAIRELMKQGKLLPNLSGVTLRCPDFFTEEATGQFDVVIGNPPWISRKEEFTESAQSWCSSRIQKRPMPGGEIAWAFVWKSAYHLKPNGIICLLLPAMGMLLNHNLEAHAARQILLSEISPLRIINFADVCFQLFPEAKRPTVLMIYRLVNDAPRHREIEYWVPKAHRLLSSTKTLQIASVDQISMPFEAVLHDPGIWKKRMWATNRDLRLLDWLDELPKLRDFIITYRMARKRKNLSSAQWVIGQGFQPYYPDAESKSNPKSPYTVDIIPEIPFLRATSFSPIVMTIDDSVRWPTSEVRREGFVDGYKAFHILIPQGIVRSQGRLRAAFLPEAACFQHSLQAISFPESDARRAKVVTAVLNSSLAAWFYFHLTSNFGADRAKVHEVQLLDLPFPSLQDLPVPDASFAAEEEIVKVMDGLLNLRNGLMRPPDWRQRALDQLDKLVFDYFGLTDEERLIITDGLEAIIPSMQPTKDEVTALMTESRSRERQAYVETLASTLSEWLKDGKGIHARVISATSPVVDLIDRPTVIELSIVDGVAHIEYESQSAELERSLRDIWKQIPQTVSRNIELLPDLKVFIDDKLYLVKPTSMRYWLRSTALADADQIAEHLMLSPSEGVAV